MDPLLETPADAGTCTSSGQQRPNGLKKSSSTYSSFGVDVKCCKRQHQVFVTCIRHALQNWGPSDELLLSYWIDAAESLWEPAGPMQVTPELKRVLTRAKNLSKDCCRELPPLQTALRHAERSEAFADILKEIHWCTSVVFHTMVCRKLESDSAALKDFPWQAQLGNREHILLENAAEEDWHQLLGELENRKRYHMCSAEDCGNKHLHTNPSYCLAGQVFTGLSSEEMKGEQDHKTLLWSFDPEVVKYVRPLGSGAFGQVAEVSWLGHNYAEKIFNRDGLATLQAEADALAKMKHPHIVKVCALSKNSLLMDLMCMDLHKFIRSRMEGGARVQPFSLPAAIDLMLQIADAVSYIHSQNMAHRDLKSANILVNPVLGGAADDGFVFAKIADLGLVKIKREITQYSHLTHNVEVHGSKCLPIDRMWPFGRLTEKVQKRGFRGIPTTWRCIFGHLSELVDYSCGPVGDIRALKVHFKDEKKRKLQGFTFSVGEELRDETIVGGGRVSTDWIRFDLPSEYLVRVEGSYSPPLG